MQGGVAGGKREARNPRYGSVTSSLHPGRGNATRFLKCRGQAEVERESVVPSNGRGVRADKENVTLPLTIGASGVGRHCSRLWDPDDDTTHENEASRERMPIDIKDGGCRPSRRRGLCAFVELSHSLGRRKPCGIAPAGCEGLLHSYRGYRSLCSLNPRLILHTPLCGVLFVQAILRIT